MSGVLPGTFPAGSSRVTVVSFFDDAVSNAATISMPAGIQAGDVAVLFDYANNSDNDTIPTDVTPAGFTQIITRTVQSAQGYRESVSYKILTGAETVITGMDDNNDNKVLQVFRGNVPINSVIPSTWNGEATNGNPATQIVVALGQSTPLVVLGSAASEAGTVSFTTASPAFDATVATADTDLITGYKVYDSNPADHSIDMGDLGFGNILMSGYLKMN